jgi:hypothetical protein
MQIKHEGWMADSVQLLSQMSLTVDQTADLLPSAELLTMASPIRQEISLQI